MGNPEAILAQLIEQASLELSKSVINDNEIQEQADFVCRCITNRAPVRLVMACLLAKIDRPHVDPRKPYTEIVGDDTFSGRHYDEAYITRFITTHRLPCNSTTAFLTPALRNIDRVLTTDVVLVGRPREVYASALQLLHSVSTGKISAEELLTEIIRLLLVIRNEKDNRIATLLSGLRQSGETLPLSSEEIVRLIEQHLQCKNASRLPVLIVAAAYKAAAKRLGENIQPLMAHNAADQQTGALGDIEITLADENSTVTVYEMKMKSVTIDDINRALHKISGASKRIDNYIFVTTDTISQEVRDYAAGLYERSSGIEIAILDCIGFLRHFLHFFHRLRTLFLNTYQELILNEPESAVSHPLKEAFLALRQAAEADE
jgi:hypothetical protein